MGFMDIRNVTPSPRDVIDRINRNFARALAQEIPRESGMSLDVRTTALGQAQRIVDDGKTPSAFIDMVDMVALRLEGYAADNNVTWSNETVRHITKCLAVRFNALVPVVLNKEELGLKGSYDAARHAHVIENAGVLAGEFGANPELARDLAKLIADRSVELQDAYLQEGNGPLAEMMNG